MVMSSQSKFISNTFTTISYCKELMNMLTTQKVYSLKYSILIVNNKKTLPYIGFLSKYSSLICNEFTVNFPAHNLHWISMFHYLCKVNMIVGIQSADIQHQARRRLHIKWRFSLNLLLVTLQLPWEMSYYSDFRSRLCFWLVEWVYCFFLWIHLQFKAVIGVYITVIIMYSVIYVSEIKIYSLYCIRL